jgi:hypothetical protein
VFSEEAEFLEKNDLPKTAKQALKTAAKRAPLAGRKGQAEPPVPPEPLDPDEAVKRMNAIREKIEEVKAERVRLREQKQIHERRCAEIEQKCKDEFGIAITAVPEDSAKLRREARQKIEEAEIHLGIRGEG